MFTVAQLRAARALLGWSQDQLAERSGVSKPTIARLELGENEAVGGYVATREKLKITLESAGVIFVEENGDGPGVRMKKTKVLMPQRTFLSGASVYENTQLRKHGIRFPGQSAPQLGLMFVYADNDRIDLMLDGAILGRASWAAGGVYFDPLISAEGVHLDASGAFQEWVSRSYERFLKQNEPSTER